MEKITDPVRYAALVAPVIDRVVIGVHLRAREPGRSLVKRHGLGRAGLLLEFRLALPRGPVARSGLEAVARYAPPDGLEEELTSQADQGMVRIEPDGAIAATPAALRFVDDMYDVHTEVLTSVWEDRAGTLDELATAAGAALVTSSENGVGPAFAAMSPPYERSGDPPATLLFNRLAALRYHRADAHAAAWAAEGLTAEGMKNLADGEMRDRIELATNAAAAAPFAALDPSTRLTLLAGLGALP